MFWTIRLYKDDFKDDYFQDIIDTTEDEWWCWLKFSTMTDAIKFSLSMESKTRGKREEGILVRKMNWPLW